MCPPPTTVSEAVPQRRMSLRDGWWPFPRSATLVIAVCREPPPWSRQGPAPVWDGRPTDRAVTRPSRSQPSWRVNSASIWMVMRSPTTTPPLSIGISMSTPNSLRLICVVAAKPARSSP